MLLQVIAWTTVVVLPIAVLLLVQIQFLPYHDAFTTWWQRLLIVLDLLLLWLLWLPAIEPTGHLSRQLRVVVQRHRRRVLRKLAKPLDWPVWAVIGLLSLFHLARTLPARIRRRLRRDPKRDWRLLRLQELSAVALLIAFLIAAIPGEFLAWPIDGLVGEGGNMGVLNRNLSLREKQLVLQLPEPGLIENIGEEKALEKYARGLDLQGRDVRYADLQLADLRKADFREGASLQGADLRRADLQGTILTGADLRGANLQSADLQGAVLGETDLRDANLRLADLQDANLQSADLQGANLQLADLQGANLFEADLQGADLFEADLQGADLRWADLRSANLQSADLRGKNLRSANLRDANLESADLRGANLQSADLQGANLQSADLRGADLRTANLWRAKIGAEPDRDDLWNLADLRGAYGLDPDPYFDLRDGEGPSWQGRPRVIFQESDTFPRALRWAAPTMTEADYDKKLATFLGDLACGDDGSPVLAQDLARRAVNGAEPFSGEPDRLFYQSLARRLTPDDPEACPAAAKLPEELRAQLKQLAARLDPPPPDQAKPALGPPEPPSREPDTALQGPGTPSQEPQTSRHDE